MKKYDVGICGHMDRNIAGENGQTLRAVTVYKELERIYGTDRTHSISSHIWKKHPLKFAFQIILLAKDSKNVIIFPDRRGIRIILPMFYILRRVLRFSLFYNVVGAWLPLFLGDHPMFRKMFTNLDGVFVETKTLQVELEKESVSNTLLFKNFKQLIPLSLNEVKMDHVEPYRLCFFSRVTPQKGIEDAIWAVSEINKSRTKYTLDIFGPIDPSYRDTFSKIVNELPPEIKYCGVVDAFCSVDTIKDYYFQLFPTKYPTEGIPGSIIDSFFAGVPVIASKWNSCLDVIDQGETGYVYDFANKVDLLNTLDRAYSEPKKIQAMRVKCINKAKEYLPEEEIKVILDLLKTDS